MNNFFISQSKLIKVTQFFSKNLLTGLVLIVSFGQSQIIWANEQNETRLRLENALIHTPPHGSKVVAIHFVLENFGSTDYTLIGAKCPSVATRTEVHNIVWEGDVAKMRKQAELLILAGQKIVFKRGSYHIMLIGLIDDLTKEQRVECSLLFEGDSELDFVAIVK